VIKIPAQLEGLVNDRVHRFATLWRLTRKDGQQLRFTNHDAGITHADQLYTPTGALSATAKQRIEGLRDRNVDFRGALVSDAITYADLLAGKYRQAKIEEYLMDWRYPWADPFASYTYFIVQTTFTGEIWEAQAEGLTHRLKQQVGRVYGRTCDVHAFGDARCVGHGDGGVVSEAAWTDGGTVTGVNVSRKDFNTTLTQTTNWYKYGYVRWTSGLNTGLTMEVNKSYGTAGRVTLWLKMPYDIAVGDTFNIVAGCDRLMGTCSGKFNNLINFRGFPYIPGTDAMLKTPNSKS
jgi:uncharacterized phage protein (TIGR02218 family)